ncbi:MAG: alpha/beta hydrolase, partial [Woeseiaceae bacterium]
MGKHTQKRQFLIDGAAGDLEALLETATDRDLAGCAVICHPHPVHGGTLQNKVTHTLARSFSGLGFAALRFNFRGVGSSEGAFDDGQGELEDVLASINWARAEYPGVPLWIAGFSFGAAMAIRAASIVAPDGLVSVAPAVARFIDGLDPQPACPWLIIQGDQDELVAVEETISWINDLDPGPELEVFTETEHFFHGKLTELRSAVEEFVDRNESRLKPLLPGNSVS